MLPLTLYCKEVPELLFESIVDVWGGIVKDGILRLFGFQKVGSYRTWLQLMCCAGLVVCPCISEYLKIQDGRIWS